MAVLQLKNQENSISLESVRQFFAERAPEITIIELAESTATVDLTAKACRITRVQIAKTLSQKVKDRLVLIVTRDDARLEDRKLREALGSKARMLSTDEVVTWSGHPVGGVCPFGLEHTLTVYCDVSLKDFEEVLPAAGAILSAVRMPPRLYGPAHRGRMCGCVPTSDEYLGVVHA